MRIGLLGGTFDPPHVGHLILAQYTLEQLELDRVVFLVAGDPWRKADRTVTPARHRLEMVRLAISGDARFAADDREVRREGPTYTVETLRELRAESPGDELFFILGEDALVDLPHWHEPARIADEARIALVPREGYAPPNDLPFARDRIELVEMPYIGISSTEVRQRARDGLSLRYLVAPAVETYIAANGLYV